MPSSTILSTSVGAVFLASTAPSLAEKLPLSLIDQYHCGRTETPDELRTGAHFDKKPNIDKMDFDRARIPIEVVVNPHNTIRELQTAYVKATGDRDAYIRDGFAQWTLSGNTPKCYIHVLKPRNSNDAMHFPVWGHELMHCVYGAFHDEK